MGTVVASQGLAPHGHRGAPSATNMAASCMAAIVGAMPTLHGGRLGLGLPTVYSLSIPDVGFIADLGGDGIITILASGHGWVAEGVGVCPCCVP